MVSGVPTNPPVEEVSVDSILQISTVSSQIFAVISSSLPVGLGSSVSLFFVFSGHSRSELTLWNIFGAGLLLYAGVQSDQLSSVERSGSTFPIRFVWSSCSYSRSPRSFFTVQRFCSNFVLSFFLSQCGHRPMWGESELIEFHLNDFAELLVTTRFVALVIYMLRFYQYCNSTGRTSTVLLLTSWVAHNDFQVWLRLDTFFILCNFPRADITCDFLLYDILLGASFFMALGWYLVVKMVQSAHYLTIICPYV